MNSEFLRDLAVLAGRLRVPVDMWEKNWGRRGGERQRKNPNPQPTTHSSPPPPPPATTTHNHNMHYAHGSNPQNTITSSRIGDVVSCVCGCALRVDGCARGHGHRAQTRLQGHTHAHKCAWAHTSTHTRNIGHTEKSRHTLYIGEMRGEMRGEFFFWDLSGKFLGRCFGGLCSEIYRYISFCWDVIY